MPVCSGCSKENIVWEELIKKASKKMIVAIVAMVLLSESDPGYIAGVAMIAIACQWSLDMKYGQIDSTE